MEIKDDLYKADLELLSKTQDFSSEILRLSLLGMAVFGFLLNSEFFEVTGKAHFFIIAVAVFFFALASLCALGHRYFSNEGFFYHLRGLRKPDDQGDHSNRNKNYLVAEWLMKGSVLMLASASLILAVGLSMGLNDSPEKSAQPTNEVSAVVRPRVSS
ncbi:hypothetical protein [Cellvibrio sp. PSBB006]|uniref:hypothetical protein n=1 Tax=Cellvibrio sp. PSBB006 TaxID=1987723 RepID=UPI000B3B49E2|nr:hypothetical protein [Cellvibrio sp. PSBB006]ARU28168.1 hypothetical protein CBR65_12445 [Cellvibrio sp. PSBB006]